MIKKTGGILGCLRYRRLEITDIEDYSTNEESFLNLILDREVSNRNQQLEHLILRHIFTLNEESIVQE